MSTFRLPRERNVCRVLSVYQRSARLARRARASFMDNPNPGTLEGRRDRTLARWAQRARVRFARAYADPRLHGAARTSRVRKTARQYRDALRAWARNYDRASGWDAYVRTNTRYATFPNVSTAGKAPKV